MVAGQRLGILALLAASAFGGTRLSADEGMWLFNDLPLELLQEKYDFTPTEAWIDHVMLSSVRFNSGGSGSFISPDGLVLTNHHVAADTIQKLSTADHNHLQDGFYAESAEAELKAPDLELNQLVAIRDVTTEVELAVEEDMDPGEAFAARRAVIADIENKALNESGLRSDVVTLYGGGQYHLYQYKKYTDIRLVWAPELGAAFFGGDPDNFEYPRYCLDAAIVRVYEDGKPAQIDNYFSFSDGRLEEGQLIFVSGNPGSTSRIETVTALEFQRDILFPYLLNFLRRMEIDLQQYGQEGEEFERRARDELFGIQNARKAYGGMLAGLQDPALMAQKRKEEETLRGKLAADGALPPVLAAWDQIREAQAVRHELMPDYYLLERGHAFRSELFNIARTLVRMAEEDQKPNTERLEEYAEQARDSLLQQLYSTAPIYKDLQQAKLASTLGMLAEFYGADDPFVQQVLAGMSPRERAADIVSGTRLEDVENRRQLAEGGPEAIEDSGDPMIKLAKLVDPRSRELRQRYEEEVEEPERQAYGQITDARFSIFGSRIYPDATFTPRLAFGTIEPYTEDGQKVPAWTTLAGAFEHEQAHGADEPWKLPESWQESKDELDLSTPLNFVSTADITGGNSGSPVINPDGELVGLIFDGNIYSLRLDFLYSERQARAISVASSAILETLQNVYGAERIAKELREARRRRLP